MTTPRRLFDCLELLMKDSPDLVLLSAKEGGQWRKYTVREVSVLVEKLCAGLLSLGISPRDMSVEKRDKVAIIAKNRPEWVLLDLAVQKIGAVLVPVYPTVHVNDMQYVFNDAEVKYVFVNDEELFHKVQSIRTGVSSIQDVFSFDHVSGCRHWKEILERGKQEHFQKIETLAAAITEEDLFTIIYTSGTTGTPKGVMLSHRNILSNVMASMPCFPPGKNLIALSFLPLNHIFERMVTYLYLFNSTSIYYAESLETIGDNLKEVRPHLFTTVPRLLEKVYEKIMAKGHELEGTKKKLFFWAHSLAEKFELHQSGGIMYKMQLALANKIIFNKWREALGNNLKCIVSGGAACQVRLIRIFTAAGIPIMEGYGLTETSPVIAVNSFGVAGRMFGTVGAVLPNVSVKIAEDGEILCKGPNVMMGYYKRNDLTEAEIKEGWFHTGDIGQMIDDKFLKITDRKKELFKTSGGKYVAPLPIENKLKESPYIEQILVLGSGQKFVGALIIPSFPNLRIWCRNQGIVDQPEDKLIVHPAVLELYRDLIESFNKYFSQVEQIKRFELLPVDWSVNTGELTPKLSLKRKVILEKYNDAVTRIYR